MDSCYSIQGEIEALLRQRMGLNPDSIGSRSILRVVTGEMRSSGFQTLSDYVAKLRNSPALFESLVESVVIRETSFFRNRPAFTFLRQWAQAWKGRHTAGPLRVLSMPCSTGEEPYSIAIALLEEGFSLNEFEVTGIDISAVAIARAKRGIYSPYAFRQQAQRSDDKYFKVRPPEGEQTRRRYCLQDSLRQKITFRQGNILNPYLLANEPPYDIIFCRNLLIYFDQAARARTFSLLNRMLKLQGLLFVGYAETNLVDPAIYKPVAYPQTFAYRKQAPKESGCAERYLSVPLTIQPNEQLLASSFSAAQQRDCLSENLSVSLPVETAAKRPSGLSEPVSEPVSELVSEPLSEPVSGLAIAQRLADKGEIQQAAVQCEAYLALYPACAQAHLLRGELYQDAGEVEAAEACFERAIYLNPQLDDALTYLMLIREERQDFVGAAVIRARLRRLLQTDSRPLSLD